MIVALLGLFSFGVFHLFANTFSYPFHASCNIKWGIDQPCDTVREKLVEQIEAWSSNVCPNVSESCPKLPCGMKCRYEMMKSDVENELKCLHRTPKEDPYTDYLTFTFEGGPTEGECIFHGYSTSGVWYALLDHGTNYCNLRNLIDGSGLSLSAGFSEKTDSSVCTQLDNIDCERY